MRHRQRDSASRKDLGCHAISVLTLLLPIILRLSPPATDKTHRALAANGGKHAQPKSTTLLPTMIQYITCHRRQLFANPSSTLWLTMKVQRSGKASMVSPFTIIRKAM